MFGAGVFRLYSRLRVYNTQYDDAIVCAGWVPMVPDMLVKTCRIGVEILQVPELHSVWRDVLQKMCCKSICRAVGLRVTTGIKDQCVTHPWELFFSSLCPTHRPSTLTGLHKGFFELVLYVKSMITILWTSFNCSTKFQHGLLYPSTFFFLECPQIFLENLYKGTKVFCKVIQMSRPLALCNLSYSYGPT